MDGGVPYEAVFGPVKRPLSATRRRAIIVAIGESKGHSFDWANNKWREKKP